MPTTPASPPSSASSPANAAEQAVVAALKAGLAAIFPTDTVYGLGVAPRFAPSPQAIYDAKRRDGGKPVAWLVGGVDDLDRYGADVPERARDLAVAHWPGALTIVVKASSAVPGAYRSTEGTIGLRAPASALVQDLIRQVGPLATSSANFSGQPAPRTLADVDAALREGIACLEGDAPASGVASTVIDCSRGCTTVVRQGGIAI